eukprot:tig00000042_g15476.t1
MMRDDDDEGHEVPIVTMEGLALHDEPVSSDTDSELERDVAGACAEHSCCPPRDGTSAAGRPWLLRTRARRRCEPPSGPSAWTLPWRPPRAPPETTGTSSSEEEEWNRARAKIPECGSHPAMSTAERAELEALLKRYSCAFADSVTATEGTANLLHYEHVIRLTSRLPVFTPRGV